METDGATTATLIESVERRIRDDIVSGVLLPQSKLRLAELKNRYAMGASPLREALSRLVGDGLVTFEGNKGFRVRGLSPHDLADIAYMRTALETFALRTAIMRGDVAWESGIVASLHSLVKLTKKTATDRVSLDAWNVVHDRFHVSLISACGSTRMLEMQRRLAEQHNRYRRFLMGPNLPRKLIVREHEQIAQSALGRDADRAAQLLGQHMQITSELYARVLAGSIEAASSCVFEAA